MFGMGNTMIKIRRYKDGQGVRLNTSGPARS